MTAYYSDHFAGQNAVTYADDNTVLAMDKRQDPYLRHGRMRYSRAEFTGVLRNVGAGPYVDWDTVQFMAFKSSDCINHVFITSTAITEAGKLNFGFWKPIGSSAQNNLEVVEIDILETDFDMAVAHNRAEVWGNGFPGANYYRGKPLWVAATLQGANTWTKDPGEIWHLTCRQHSRTVFTDEITMVVEAYYTSGD